MRKIQFDGQEYTVEQYREMAETLVRRKQERMSKLLERLDNIINQHPRVIKEDIELEPLRLPHYTLELKISIKQKQYSAGYFRYIKVGEGDNAFSNSDWHSWDYFANNFYDFNKTHDYEPYTVYQLLQQLQDYCVYLERLGDDIHYKRIELIESQRDALEYIISEYTLLKMTDEK